MHSVIYLRWGWAPGAEACRWRAGMVRPCPAATWRAPTPDGLPHPRHRALLYPTHTAPVPLSLLLLFLFALLHPARDPTEWVKHQQAMSGPAMLFCTLVAKNPRTSPAQPWTNASVSTVAFEWRELLRTAGIEAQVFDISDVESKAPEPSPGADAAAKADAADADAARPAPRLLVTTNTGWRGYEVRDFLIKQPELAEMEWDQVKYHPGDEANMIRPGDAGHAGGSGAGDPMAAIRAAMGGLGGGQGAPGGAKKKGKAKAKPKAKPNPKPKPRATPADDDDDDDEL
jgi:hypothetical protein